MLLGPYTLYRSPVQNVDTIRQVADVGLVILLFAVGVELGWERIRRVGMRVVLIGAVEISVMVGLGYQAGLLLGWTPTESFFLGAALSVSSSAVLVKMLRDSGDLHSTRGQLIVGILVVEDFAAVVFLSVLSGIATQGDGGAGQILPIVLHFERDTPRRDSLGENFEKAFSKIAAGLSDYKVGHGNLCDKLQKHEKFTKSNLDKIVVREFAKLQRAGPIIDKILSGLPKGGSQRCTECGGRAGQNRSCRTCLDYTDV